VGGVGGVVDGASAAWRGGGEMDLGGVRGETEEGVVVGVEVEHHPGRGFAGAHEVAHDLVLPDGGAEDAALQVVDETVAFTLGRFDPLDDVVAVGGLAAGPGGAGGGIDQGRTRARFTVVFREPDVDQPRLFPGKGNDAEAPPHV